MAIISQPRREASPGVLHLEVLARRALSATRRNGQRVTMRRFRVATDTAGWAVGAGWWCQYVSTYNILFVCMYIYIYISIHINTDQYISIRIYIYIYIYIYIHINTYNMLDYIYIYIDRYTHMCIAFYSHIQIQAYHTRYAILHLGVTAYPWPWWSASSQGWAKSWVICVVNWWCAVEKECHGTTAGGHGERALCLGWCFRISKHDSSPWNVWLCRHAALGVVYIYIYLTHWNLGTPTERVFFTFFSRTFVWAIDPQMLHVLSIFARLPALIQRKQEMQVNHPQWIAINGNKRWFWLHPHKKDVAGNDIRPLIS